MNQTLAVAGASSRLGGWDVVALLSHRHRLKEDPPSDSDTEQEEDSDDDFDEDWEDGAEEDWGDENDDDWDDEDWEDVDADGDGEDDEWDDDWDDDGSGKRPKRFRQPDDYD